MGVESGVAARSMNSSRGAFEPSFEVVEVTRLIEKACEEVAPVASLQGLALQVLQGAVIHFRVVADPELIGRLLVNLLQNAIDVTPPGKTVTLAAKPVPGGVRLAVRDCGPGLPAENPEELPDDFTTNAGGEHGTGLADCHMIAMLHGGLLRSTNLEHGAEVFFILPDFSRQACRAPVQAPLFEFARVRECQVPA